jgi:hypothetical protein
MDALHLARATDPVTSHVAAENVHKFAAGHKERILAAMAVCLQVCAVRGATAHEIAAESGLTFHQVDRRMNELLKADKVRRVRDTSGALVSRANSAAWELVGE